MGNRPKKSRRKINTVVKSEKQNITEWVQVSGLTLQETRTTGGYTKEQAGGECPDFPSATRGVDSRFRKAE